MFFSSFFSSFFFWCSLDSSCTSLPRAQDNSEFFDVGLSLSVVSAFEDEDEDDEQDDDDDDDESDDDVEESDEESKE